jgi:hypothetical protein
VTDPPRILVLTLYTGEREFERSLDSLRVQTCTSWEHKVFEFLPNKAAHEALQREVTRRSDDFDLFVKLDADMVFRERHALERIAELFRAQPDVDHTRSVVRDWFSDSLVMGLHIWSNRVRWEPSDERLFVDTAPVYPGRRLTLWSAPAPFVDHSPDPAPQQAFHFGVHRALKALQRERPLRRFSYGLSRGQWQILRGTWAHFRRSGDPRLALAVMGAELVLTGRIAELEIADKRDTRRELYEEFAALSADELARRLAPRWDRTRGAPLSYFARVTPRRVASLPLEVWRKLRYGETS